MSTIESLRSCLEPLLLEPRDLKHQLLPSQSLLSFECPPPPPPPPPPQNQLTKHFDSLSKKIGEEPRYVHPLSAKASYLSSKSLEMCTESLGCETGNGIDQFSVDEEEEQPRRQQPIKKAKAKNGGGKLNFPPPLRSISGGGGVQVHSHREGGRLVIKASSLSSASRFFQAERWNGRLRLSLLKEGGKEEVGEAEMDCGGGEEEGFVGEEVCSSSSSSSRCNGEKSSRERCWSYILKSILLLCIDFISYFPIFMRILFVA